jgi:hypothetical protein
MASDQLTSAPRVWRRRRDDVGCGVGGRVHPAPGLRVVDLGGALLACATGVVRPQLPAGTAKLARVPAGDCGHTDRNCDKLPVDLHDSPYAALRVEPPRFGSYVPLTRISSGLASCIRGRSPGNSAQIKGKRSPQMTPIRLVEHLHCSAEVSAAESASRVVGAAPAKVGEAGSGSLASRPSADISGSAATLGQPRLIVRACPPGGSACHCSHR